MKITFVSHSSSLLGASRSILPIIAECKKQGMDVEVLSHGRGPFVSKIDSMGLNTRLLWGINSRSSVLRMIFRFIAIFPNFIFMIWRLCISRPDVLYVNTIDKALPVVVGRLLNLNCIVHVREGKDYINSNKFARKVLSKLIFNNARHFICVSKETSNSVKKVISSSRNRTRCQCIYNGVAMRDDKINGCEIYRFKDSNTVRIGFVGGGSHRKRLDVFLGALGIAQTRDNNIQGVVVGPSKKEFRDALRLVDQQYCHKLNVEHLEFQENINDIMSSLDILCLTSDVEAFGRVIIEAAQFSIPVIASNVTGPSEIIMNHVSGLLFNRGNISDLAEKMIQLSERPELRKQYGKVMKQRADFLFSEENYVAQCVTEIQIYGSV